LIKVFSLLKRRPDMSLQDFRKWILEEHSKLALSITALRRYTLNVLREDEPEAEFDAVSEMWFDGEEAYRAAFLSEQGKEAARDVMAHCSRRTHLVVQEHQFR